MNDSVTKGIDAQKAAMTLSANELKLYNANAQLTAQYNKDIVGKSPEQIKQLTAALEENRQKLVQNYQETQQWTQSWAGLGAGANQAFTTMYEEANNMNKMGSELVTTFGNQLTSAITNLGTEGSKAWTQMGVAMLQFFDGLIIKWALAKAAMAIMEGMGMTPQEAGAIVAGGAGLTKSAQGNAFMGGSVMQFAQGGIVSTPSVFNMGTIAEVRPEAIMPLQRDAAGNMGVAMVSGGSSGVTHVHMGGGTIVVNSNKDPHQIAKEVNRQAAQYQKLQKSSIAQQMRPGGLINRAHANNAFAR